MVVEPSEKSRLRQQLRRERSERAEDQWQTDSARLCGHLAALGELQVSERIALFWPLLRRREPDLRPLDRLLRDLGKRIYYPCMHGPGGTSQWGFRQVTDLSQLKPSGGLFEPDVSCTVALAGDIQLIVTPCLALDDAGYRLGYGAGFYDRVLQRFAPPAFVVGVCFASERLPRLPREAHDRPVDWVVTDAGSCAA